jgi:hypothetical protein
MTLPTPWSLRHYLIGSPIEIARTVSEHTYLAIFGAHDTSPESEDALQSGVLREFFGNPSG